MKSLESGNIKKLLALLEIKEQEEGRGYWRLVMTGEMLKPWKIKNNPTGACTLEFSRTMAMTMFLSGKVPI